jgi:predicted amidohydrolase
MTIGIIQPNIVSDEIEINLQHCEELIKSLADVANTPCGVQIFLLPEMFATGFPATKEQAEPELLTEDSVNTNMQHIGSALHKEDNRQAVIQLWMKRVAREQNAVVAGSVAVKVAAAESDREVIYNRLVWMRPTGEYFTYDKRHLFGAEKEIYQQGGQIVTVQEQGWNFRLNVCYDLRFPAWCKNRRLYGSTLDYDAVLFPASWPSPRISVWKTLIPARAVENLAYSIGINRSGKDINGTRYNGQSIASDPQGNVIANLDEKPQATIVTLNKERLERLRQHITVAHDWDEYELKQ